MTITISSKPTDAMITTTIANHKTNHNHDQTSPVPGDELRVDPPVGKEQRARSVPEQPLLDPGVKNEALPKAVEVTRRKLPLMERRNVLVPF